MKRSIHPYGLLLAFLALHQFALSQADEMLEPSLPSVEENTTRSIQRFYFIPGGGYFGRHAPNTFTITLCSYMEGLLGHDFKIIEEPLSKIPVANVGWALFYGQKPIRQPEKNRKVMLAFKRILADTMQQADQINIVSSSFGTVLASQLAIKLARFYKSEPVQPEINLILGASMLEKDSKLFQELIKFQQEGSIACIIHDELQDEGDNVNGMCGKSRLQAFANAFKIACVFGGNYLGQPSILNNHPYKGHIHLQRAQSVQKGKDFVEVSLIDYELGGPRIRERALEIMSQRE